MRALVEHCLAARQDGWMDRPRRRRRKGITCVRELIVVLARDGRDGRHVHGEGRDRQIGHFGRV